MLTKPCDDCRGTGRVIDPKAVGSALRRKRNKVGISQEAIGLRMGLSKQHICALEKGNRNWTKELITRYEKALK